MQFSEKPKRRVIISVTSLIDVMFLLLIFFMVTSTFLEQAGMKLDLPSARSAETTVTRRLVLFIGADNSLVLGDRPVPIDSLEALMAEAASSSEDGTLVLNADKTVQHGTVIRVMDIAKRAGMKRLVVGTKDEGR
ncbi:MAG: biopolymer transporter ExbD [Candidatus Krumholzibacteria bacterium]|jgi:biopolymer transport protein ExbD|nr:biopolymer transporter ExbD [Candidatus Krumholzibacteria bacterium]